MKVGISYFATDNSLDPRVVAEAVEQAGFESLWFPEHSHIPASRLSPYPRGGPLPDHYRRTLDPFVALATAAAVTSTLRVGTGICLIAQRDVINLAKQIATLDHISNGRFLFGVGAGWNREEMEDHGVDFRDRWRYLLEAVEALKAIWTDDVAEYHGTLIDFDPFWMWPKPVQRPHPPIILGISGPTALEKVLASGDGWMPNGDNDALERVPALRAMTTRAGRAEIPVTLYAGEHTEAELSRFDRGGVDRCILHVPVAPGPDQLQYVQDLAGIAEEWLAPS